MNTRTITSIEKKLGEQKVAHLDEEIINRRRSIDLLASQNVEYTQIIANNLQQMRAANEILDSEIVASANGAYADHLVEEWKQLVDHPRLANASLRENTLTLTTTDDLRLHCEGREDTRWLGAFEVKIKLDQFDIRLANLNTRRGGRDHPHVVGGAPCFGGDHRAFIQLHSNGDLFVLFEMLLQYLETLNLRDEYGRYGSYWFDRDDERPVT